MKGQFANIITGLRIVCSVLLLHFPVFSTGFYTTYLLCGFSDMIDGAVARKTHSTSSFGAKFDTVADIVFMTVVGCKLLPAIHLPQWMWIWIGVIAVVKLSNIVWGLLRRKSLIAIHSIINKIAGVTLFVIPLTIPVVELKYSVTTACLIATCAAIHEGYYIKIGREVV